MPPTMSALRPASPSVRLVPVRLTWPKYDCGLREASISRSGPALMRDRGGDCRAAGFAAAAAGEATETEVAAEAEDDAATVDEEVEELDA